MGPSLRPPSSHLEPCWWSLCPWPSCRPPPPTPPLPLLQPLCHSSTCRAGAKRNSDHVPPSSLAQSSRDRPKLRGMVFSIHMIWPEPTLSLLPPFYTGPHGASTGHPKEGALTSFRPTTGATVPSSGKALSFLKVHLTYVASADHFCPFQSLDLPFGTGSMMRSWVPGTTLGPTAGGWHST